MSQFCKVVKKPLFLTCKEKGRERSSGKTNKKHLKCLEPLECLCLIQGMRQHTGNVLNHLLSLNIPLYKRSLPRLSGVFILQASN